MWLELILFLLAINIAYFLSKFLINHKSVPFSKLYQISTKYENRDIERIIFNTKEFYTRIDEENFFSGKVNKVHIALRSGSTAYFTIEKRRWFTKILEYFSLVTPCNLSNDILLFTDEQTLINQLDKSEIKDKIIEIFSQPKLYDTKKIWIEGKDGDIILHFKLNKNFKKKQIEIEKFLEIYNKPFNDFFISIDFSKILSTETSSLSKKLKPLNFLLTFTTVLGVFLLLFYHIIHYDDIINDSVYLLYVSLMSSVVIPIVILYLFKKIPKSSFKLKKALQYTLVSFLAVFMLSAWIIKYANSFFDASNTEIVKLEILQKYGNKGYYYVKVKQNNKQIDKLQISYKLYQKPLLIFVFAYCREGALGIKWVENVKEVEE